MKKKTAAFFVLIFLAIVIGYLQMGESTASRTAPPGQAVRARQDSRSPRKPQSSTATRRLIRDVESPPNRQVENIRENEEMAKEDKNPEGREWRLDWIDEKEDAEWTKRMMDDVNHQVDSLGIKGKVQLTNLSCRETICRMYMQFDRAEDASSFTTAVHSDGYQYSYQLLNPPRPGNENVEKSQSNFEVLIKRERPDDLPEDSRPLPSDSAYATATAGSEG
jgi:hypothetical protein